jgi:hypothetical protein
MKMFNCCLKRPENLISFEEAPKAQKIKILNTYFKAYQTYEIFISRQSDKGEWTQEIIDKLDYFFEHAGFADLDKTCKVIDESSRLINEFLKLVYEKFTGAKEWNNQLKLVSRRIVYIIAYICIKSLTRHNKNETINYKKIYHLIETVFNLNKYTDINSYYTEQYLQEFMGFYLENLKLPSPFNKICLYNNILLDKNVFYKDFAINHNSTDNSSVVIQTLQDQIEFK